MPTDGKSWMTHNKMKLNNKMETLPFHLYHSHLILHHSGDPYHPLYIFCLQFRLCHLMWPVPGSGDVYITHTSPLHIYSHLADHCHQTVPLCADNKSADLFTSSAKTWLFQLSTVHIQNWQTTEFKHSTMWLVFNTRKQNHIWLLLCEHHLLPV